MADDEDNVVSIVPKLDAKLEVEDDDSEVTTAEETFGKATSAGFKEVVIIGVTEDGMMGYISNIDDIKDVVYLLEATKSAIFK